MTFLLWTLGNASWRRNCNSVARFKRRNLGSFLTLRFSKETYIHLLDYSVPPTKFSTMWISCWLGIGLVNLQLISKTKIHLATLTIGQVEGVEKVDFQFSVFFVFEWLLFYEKTYRLIFPNHRGRRWIFFLFFIHHYNLFLVLL